jgi:predicted RND superfamily exporter protein
MKRADAAHFQPIASLDQFDAQSGNALERLLFNYRAVVVLLCALVTAILGFQLSSLKLNASYADAIPTHHPFIRNYFVNESELKGLSNVVRIVVERKSDGDVFDREYLEALRAINDEVYNLPGVDRSFVRSLWMPAVRWLATTDEGYEGGPVMPDDYDGSPASLGTLRENVMRSGEVGQLVAPDFKSTIIYVPLLELSPETGERLDYGKLSRSVEDIRAKYDAQGVRVRVVGFAKVMGDLIEGLYAILGFFAVSVVVTAAILLAFTRCLRSTALVIGCTLVAVIWLLGLLPLIGFELNPYSILIPFLIFAIGVSHGAQKMNGIMQDIGRGAHKLVAARYTFRRLFLAGATALLADAMGFAVLKLIDIPVIGNLATIASIGVGILIFTNLALLPQPQGGIGVRRHRAPEGRAVALPRLLHVSEVRGDRAGRRAGDRRRRLHGQPPPADRRPRQRRTGAAPRLALQPRQHLSHRQLSCRHRRPRRDG